MSVVKALKLGKLLFFIILKFNLNNQSFLDTKSQRKFIEFYNSKFGDDENSLVFRVFERSGGEYYSIHGRDTATALKTSMKSSVVIKNMQPDELPGLKYASFNRNIFEKILREILIVIGYKVEVYTSLRANQEEWTLEYKGSPGNLTQFEDMLFNSAESEILSNLLCSLQLDTTRQQKVIKIELNYKYLKRMTNDCFFCRKSDLLVLTQPSIQFPLQRLRILPSFLSWKQQSFCYLQKNAFFHQLLVIMRRSRKFWSETECL